jgi:hypothetical protein
MCSNLWILMRKEKVLLPSLWGKNRVEFFLVIGWDWDSVCQVGCVHRDLKT